ncbi:MAG: hypothetical protein ACT4P7_19150 [Gemmatimonadaceae bacterium]
MEQVGVELANHLRPLCTSKGRMLGVFLADGEWIVTLSSVAAVSQEFVNAVLDFDPAMSPIAHDWSTVPRRSLGGHDLTSWLHPPTKGAPINVFFKVSEPQPPPAQGRKFRHTLPLAGGEGCYCAAPKLISYLTQDAGAALLPPASVAMIELWCGKAQGNWSHGHLARSCEECKRILPTLACRART